MAAVVGLVASLVVGAAGETQAAATNSAFTAPRWTDSPWTDMSDFSWREARFAEYRTHGPGAQVTVDRPQLSDADAVTHTVADYLRGTDGWAPYARR